MKDQETPDGLQVPKEWDKDFILNQLEGARNQPSLVAHYIRRLKEIFVLNIDRRTAEERLRFIRTAIIQKRIATDYLKAEKEELVAQDDLALHDKERKIRNLKLDLETGELENRGKRQETLVALEIERDTLKVDVEIAKLTKEIDEFKNPQPSQQPPTREEERVHNYEACQADINRTRKERVDDLDRMRREGYTEEEIRLKENFWDDAIRQKLELLRKFM